MCLAKVFENLGDYSPQDAIHWLVNQQANVGQQLGVSPPTLLGRPLHAIDCQNLLCEVDKYARVAFPHLRSNRTQIKQSRAGRAIAEALLSNALAPQGDAAGVACRSGSSSARCGLSLR